MENNTPNPLAGTLPPLPSTEATTPQITPPSETPWPTKKKSNFKYFVLGFAVIALIIGGAFGAFYFTQNLNQASVPTAPQSEPMAAGTGANQLTGEARLEAVRECEASGCRKCSWNGVCVEGAKEETITKVGSTAACGVAAPTALSVEKISPTNVKLKWTAGTGGTTILLVSKHADPIANCFLKNAGDAALCIVDQNTSITTTTHNLTNLTADTTYYWLAGTWKDNTCYAASSVSSFKTDPAISCSVKYFFKISTDETNGVNNGACTATANQYDSAKKDCSAPHNTCSQNVKTFIPSPDQANATCYDTLEACQKPAGKTVSFLYFYNKTTKECKSTNHRYDENKIDVDGTPTTCSQNVLANLGTASDGVCYNTLAACNAAYTTACTPSTWTPNPNTVCAGDDLEQTSNCGTKRTVDGTKVCEEGEAELYVEKWAFEDEEDNKSGDYELRSEIDTVSREQVFVYAFDVYNAGEGKAKNIVVSDTLKGNNQELLTYVDGDSRCKYTSSTRKVVCSGMELDSEEDDVYAFRVKVSNTATNGETIRNVGVVTYENMPSDGEIDASLELNISTVVSCNQSCTGDSECSSGLTCDPDVNKCRKAVCADSTNCVCPLPSKDPTEAPTKKATAAATEIAEEPEELPEAGILDLPGVAAFGGGLLLAIIGILLAL